MTKPPKHIAIARLQKAHNAIRNLISLSPDSPEYQKWKRDTRVMLAHTFGDESEQLKEFESRQYAGVRRFGAKGVDFPSFVPELRSKGAKLASMIDEVKEYWEDSPPITTPDINVSGRMTRNDVYDASGDRNAVKRVFIGHGRSQVWYELKDFLQEQMELTVDEFNRVPAAGVATTDRLREMLDSAAVAFLVMTGENEQASGTLRPRENVVHEAGLFQGRLGFKRAIVLLEEGCDKFSNNAGLGHIPFPKNNIRASFQDVREVLEREGMVASRADIS